MFDVAAFGPFVGDWKYETFVFRPYIKWVSETINIDKIYVSSHTNRLFLYDWIDKDNRIPIYEDISRDETLQNGSLHKNVTRSDYNLFVRLYKEELSKKCNCYINYFPLNYTNFFQYPLYCRLFSKIHINKKNNGGYYLFIPDETEKVETINKIYMMLTEEYGDDIIVCGDMKTRLNENNVVLSKKDYFENGYEYILSYINNAKAVICPMGFWTFLVNLQGKPVYSWVTDKGNTIYRNILDGKKYTIVQTNNPNTVVKGFKEFIKKM